LSFVRLGKKKDAKGKKAVAAPSVWEGRSCSVDGEKMMPLTARNQKGTAAKEKESNSCSVNKEKELETRATEEKKSKNPQNPSGTGKGKRKSGGRKEGELSPL